jgi:hypothetical protein
MGDDNFTDDKMVESRALVVQFVVDLFKEKVVNEHRETYAGDASQALTPTQDNLEDGTMEDPEGDDDLLISLLINKASATVPEPTQAVTLEMVVEDLRKKVEEEMLSYVTFCKNIDWKEMCVKYGTEKHKKLLREQPSEAERCGVNPRLTRTLFDVIGWWRNHGLKLFPRLAVGAFIVLAKVAHNGFQERVFSIGTFLDTKQQKRREERHYEMDVLQRINSDILLEHDEFYASVKKAPGEDEKEQINEFFKFTEEVQDKHVAKLVDKEGEAATEVPEQVDDDDVSVDVPLKKDEGDDSDENKTAQPVWQDFSTTDESDSE